MNNIRDIKRVILVGVFMCVVQLIRAQNIPTYDRSVLHERRIDSAKITEFKNSKDFKYDSEYLPAESFWGRIFQAIAEWLKKIFGERGVGLAVEWIFILLASALLVFFILKIFGMNKAGLFGKRNNREGLDYEVLSDDIHRIPFDELLHNAVLEKNYRLCTRLLFLQSLKMLSDQDLINWQPDKTNLAYLNELVASNFFSNFKFLTSQFEKHWYGEASLDEKEFGLIRNGFDDFKRMIIER